MPQEYTVSTWQPWEDEEGPIRDTHGNFKGTVFFNESPKGVDATFKTQPAAGDKKFGDIVDYQTKAGKTRQKFQRAERPQDGQQTSFTGTAKKEWQPRDDNAIRAQWAIGQARELFVSSVLINKTADMNLGNLTNWNNGIEAAAHIFYEMVDRVKDSSPKAEAPALTKSVEEEQAQRQAERDAAALHAVAIEDKVYLPEQDEPINLDDIPF